MGSSCFKEQEDPSCQFTLKRSEKDCVHKMWNINLKERKESSVVPLDCEFQVTKVTERHIKDLDMHINFLNSGKFQSRDQNILQCSKNINYFNVCRRHLMYCKEEEDLEQISLTEKVIDRYLIILYLTAKAPLPPPLQREIPRKEEGIVERNARPPPPRPPSPVFTIEEIEEDKNRLEKMALFYATIPLNKGGGDDDDDDNNGATPEFA